MKKIQRNMKGLFVSLLKRIGKENSQGQTPMWSLSNLASLIKNQADEELLVSSRSSNKYRYQANRAFVIGRIKRILPKILCGILKLPSIDLLFQDSLRCRSQIIPGRSFRRKMNITVRQSRQSGVARFFRNYPEWWLSKSGQVAQRAPE